MTAQLIHRRSLREVAAEVERSSGMTVEIIGGVIMLSPSPRGKHAGTARRLQAQIDSRIPAGLTALRVVSVRALADPDDYATPDLVVLPQEFEESDEWLADPTAVELVLEVVSVSNASKDTTTMPVWYAQQAIPLFLLVDPRHGEWTLYSAPRDGEYHGTLRGKYGDEVPLPAPFGAVLRTDGLPLYGRASR